MLTFQNTRVDWLRVVRSAAVGIADFAELSAALVVRILALIAVGYADSLSKRPYLSDKVQ